MCSLSFLSQPLCRAFLIIAKLFQQPRHLNSKDSPTGIFLCNQNANRRKNGRHQVDICPKIEVPL